MMDYSSFKEQVESFLPGLVHQIQFKDLLSDPRTSHRQDLPAFNFQTQNPGFCGWLSRHGVWTVIDNDGRKTGTSLDNLELLTD